MRAHSVALVTGASSGIGRAIAIELARREHDLIVTARRKDLLDQLAQEVQTRFGRRAEVIQADLSTAAGCQAVEARIDEGVAVLVANAGFSTRGSFPRLPLETELTEVEVNVVSTLRLCHTASRVMRRRGRGRILVTSSAASFQPLPGLATYGASKAFVTAFAQALDSELRPLGVSVTCLAPGYTAKSGDASRPGPRWLWSTPDEVARAGVEGLLAGRRLVVPGLPWKVAAMLAPRMPRFVTRAIAGSVAKRMLDHHERLDAG
jgi:uncharacterized protein